MQELVNVTFRDLTNYQTYNGSDVVGIPVPYYWGPEETLMVLNKDQFLDKFPASDPAVNFGLEWVYPWAQAMRALEMGAPFVEVWRPKGFKYFNWKFTKSDPSDPAGIVTTFTPSDETIILNVKPDTGTVFAPGSSFAGNFDFSKLETFEFAPAVMSGPAVTKDDIMNYFNQKVQVVPNKTLRALYELESKPYSTKIEDFAELMETVKPGFVSDTGYLISGMNWMNIQVPKDTAYMYTELASLAAIPRWSSSKWNSDVENTGIAVALKYSGFVPKSYYRGFDDIRINLSLNESTFDDVNGAPFKVTIYGQIHEGKTLLSEEVLEQYLADWTNETFVDGKRVFIEDLIKSSSLIDIKVAIANGLSQNIDLYLSDVQNTSIPTFNIADVVWSECYKHYKDIDESEATVIMPALSKHSINQICLEIADTKKTATAIVGFPLDQTDLEQVYQYTQTDIESYHKLLKKTMFGEFIQGQEKVSYMGRNIIMDCVASVVGRTIAVATEVRTNQLPSARTYGLYDTVLTKSFEFSTVLALHDKGIGSVYNTVYGPMIFSVRSLHIRQNSYFGRFNVSRVTAKILKPTISRVLAAIHTDTVSDVFMRAALQNDLQAIIDNEIGARNVNPLSQALVLDSENADAKTRGGELLVVDLVLYYKKLVERASIRITATDSSVSVSIF